MCELAKKISSYSSRTVWAGVAIMIFGSRHRMPVRTDALSDARMVTETCPEMHRHGHPARTGGNIFLRLTHQAVFYGVLVVPNGSR